MSHGFHYQLQVPLILNIFRLKFKGMRQKPIRPQSTATHSIATKCIVTVAIVNKQLSAHLRVTHTHTRICLVAFHAIRGSAAGSKSRFILCLRPQAAFQFLHVKNWG